MRLQYILLLAAAAILARADVSASPISEAPSVVDEMDTLTARLLRIHAVENDDDDKEEERVFMSFLKNLFGSKTAPNLRKAAQENKQLDDLAQEGLSVGGAFARMNLDDTAKLDDLLSHPNFRQWAGFMAEANRQSSKGTTVAKFLRSKYGDEQAVRTFAKASASSDPALRELGKGYELDLMKQWVKVKKSQREVAALAPSLVEDYSGLYKKALDKAKAASKKAEAKVEMVRM
ncbi:hypothetical protein ON010_g7667 [Phytophthora cinnamomi]|nr:hypothetical protein ON010_g7667 [Phytophthora cinnamomi]